MDGCARWHSDCGEALRRLKNRMRQRHRVDDYRHPLVIRLEFIANEVEWLLEQPTVRQLKIAFGDKEQAVEDMLIDIHTALTRMGWDWKGINV